MAETTKSKEFLKKCFSKKMLIQKGIIAAAALVVVLALSLSFYFWLKDKNGFTLGDKNKSFWYIVVDYNPNVGFGNYIPTGGIFAIQAIMFLLLLAIFLFLCDSKITASFVALAMFGGLFNLFQRASYQIMVDGRPAVLDYFMFGHWFPFPFIFNWPDVCVVIGIGGFVISYIILTIMEAVKESKAEKAKKAAAQKPNDEQPKQQC